ncbi:MAG: 6-phosphogluconolactonase [Alphaproteobacteria bacterium]|nr:MAG: 6-phosphogluconolactonase [Alphaproteobacteria bacterium]
MEFVEYPDRDMMFLDLADRLASELAEALHAERTATFAVPGGTTPGPVFDALSGLHIEWDRVVVLPTDERWVPEDSPRSNARLIRQRLLVGKAAAARFVPLYLSAERPEDRLADLAEAVSAVLPLSVLLLGMGEDGHTASLFPRAEGLAEALDDDAPPVAAIRAPGAPEPRVTLTGPVLRGAVRTHVLITGARKREVLFEAVERDDPLAMPIATVLDEATVHWAA